jgi:uncharacterized phage-associated protein
MPRHSVLAIANEFIGRARATGQTVTPMQLEKLCYFAHGFDLALFDQPLTSEKIEAWDWGPVYPDLYDALRKYGSKPVTDFIHLNNWATHGHVRGPVVGAQLSDIECALLDTVWRDYGSMEAFQLSAITHEKGSAWDRVYKPGVRHTAVPDDYTKEQFVGLTQS